MNLYLLERQDDVGYDEFDSIVVAAPSEGVARAIRPRGGWVYGEAWDEAETLTCTNIGTTHLPIGIVHESFNAG
ncbi:hypothetical protein pSALSNUABM04_004 [Salmonella phage pSal-SNUABM-04]|nr:hypothetical protein pSALSNUABM04_004 [Salmonella phage pSal-SNUABM-04]